MNSTAFQSQTSIAATMTRTQAISNRPHRASAWRLRAIGIDDIVAEKGHEGEDKGILRRRGLAVAIDRERVDGFAFGVLAVTIAAMMAHVHVFIKGLRKAERQGFHQAESPVQPVRAEIGIVQEIVGNAVDVPGNADGVDHRHGDQQPPGRDRKQEEQRQHIGQMRHTRQNRNDIPA